MGPDTAKVIVVSVAAVGLIVWAVGFRGLLRLLAVPNIEETAVAVKGKSAEDARKALIRAAMSPDCRVSDAGDGAVKVELPQQLRATVSFKFEDVYGGASVTCSTDLTRLNAFYRIKTLAILAAGLAAIGVVVAVMWVFVIPSPMLAIRWQSVQAVQIVHFLWPPFRFFRQHREMRFTVQTFASNLLAAVEVAE